MILLEMTTTDIIIVSIIGFLASCLYIASGLNLIIRRSQANVSQKYIFNNPERFVLILGLIELFVGVVIAIMITIGLIWRGLFLLLALISGGIFITSVVVETILQKKYRRK